jgi:hypothetical protein
MKVSFTSDGSGSGAGFSATYTSVETYSVEQGLESLDTPWFWKRAISDLPFVVSLSINLGIIVIGSLLRWMSSKEGSRVIFVLMKGLILTQWFLFDFSFMCARFNWYLSSGFEIKVSDDPDACTFWWLKMGANIDISSDGAEHFSIGLGLLIWALIAITVILMELSISLEEELESGENICTQAMKTIFRLLLIHLVSTLFCCQQSCVLLPLTTVSMHPTKINVPTDPVKAVCYHKWAVVAIPYGIPMILGGVLSIGLAAAICRAGIVGIIIGLGFVCAGGMLVLTAIGLIAFWLLAGYGIGVWFTFGSLDVLIDLGLIKILVGPSIFLLDACSAFVSMTIGSAACCAALIICPSYLQHLSSRNISGFLLGNIFSWQSSIQDRMKRLWRFTTGSRELAQEAQVENNSSLQERERQQVRLLLLVDEL